MGGKLTMIHGYDDTDKSKVEVLSKDQAASKDDLGGIQNQLSNKSNNGHTHDDRYYTESEMNTKLNGKQNTINGGASSITTNNLTANKALVSNGSGKVSASSVTAQELAYLTGLTGNVQPQLNNRYTKQETDNKVSGLNISGKCADQNFEIQIKGTDNKMYRFLVTNGTLYFQRLDGSNWVNIHTW